MNKFAIFVFVVCMAAAVVCDAVKETHASGNKANHPEGEKHKSIFSQALNLTKAEKTHLREVFGNMTAESKAACTPESQKKEHTPEEKAAWKTMSDAGKIAKIQANWATKTEEQKACALHIHDLRKEQHKKDGKDHKEKGKDQKKEDPALHH